MPFLIKDSGRWRRGVPFFLGSRVIPGIVARFDTDLMTRFRAAGLVTLGLSFATESRRHGPTRNLWDL